MTALRVCLVLILLCPLPATPQPDDPAVAQRELKTLRQRIRSLEQQLAEQRSNRGSAAAALQQVERDRQAARRELDRLDTQLSQARTRLTELERNVNRRAAELAGERAALGRQLRLAYTAGREEWLRILLSGDDPIAGARQLVYFSYLDAARSEAVAAIRARLESLRSAQAAAAEQAARLAVLRQSQAKRAEELAAVEAQRRDIIARLDRDIAAGQGEVSMLEGQAEQLRELVEELTRALADLPVGDDGGFVARRGEMDWPVQGKALQRYGQKRADGQLRWQGQLIAADSGAEVKAVHRGRVVFADWLSGMGLLAVIDHGDGFMTLYAHNQDLLREVGDWVAPGEVIAHVGDSGGQARPALYFEIRRNGRPVDPWRWMRR
jgi:septal ring factor EnvC (AmiA/AmiB activator)